MGQRTNEATMRRRAALALPLLAAVLLAAPAVTLAAAMRTVVPYFQELEYLAPPDDCITEFVYWRGFAESEIVTVYDGSGGVIRRLHFRQRLEGVGQTTGTAYLNLIEFRDFQRGNEFDTGEGAMVHSLRSVYFIVSKGGAENYLAELGYQMVVSASGIPTSTEPTGWIKCVG
jgi:hypothetical protein